MNILCSFQAAVAHLHCVKGVLQRSIYSIYSIYSMQGGVNSNQLQHCDEITVMTL